MQPINSTQDLRTYQGKNPKGVLSLKQALGLVSTHLIGTCFSGIRRGSFQMAVPAASFIQLHCHLD